MKNFLATVLTICHILSFTACGSDGSGSGSGGDGLKIEMIKIPGGTFMMGSPPAENMHGTEETQHSVVVSGFQMGKYEVTQKQYKAVTGSDPSRFKGDKLPVEKVSWYDAVEFCNKLSKKEGLKPVYTITNRTPERGYPITIATVVADLKANGYRLPTEAEWEYACRGEYANKATETATKPFGIGDYGTKMVYNMANFDTSDPYPQGETTAIPLNKTIDVGTYKPNSYGLYDMHGNVYEWCWDWYEANYYAGRPNPVGPSSGTVRVVRGGSWYSPGRYLRSASRNYDDPGRWGSAMGFRVVRL